MSKKKHSKTQQLLEQKHRLQQQLVSDRPITQVIQDKRETAAPVALPAEKAPEPELIAHQPTGLKRTLINTVIILVLLTGAIIVDRQTPYLQDLGGTLYTSLKLAQ